MKFQCEICSKKHDIYFGIKADFSPRLSEINAENPSRVKEFEGFYIVDKSKVVLPGQISIKTEYELDFYYQTWVEVDVKLFILFSEAYDGSKGGLLNGKLFDDLNPYFPNTKGLECIMEYFVNMKSDEYAQVSITKESKLKSVQEKGLSKLEIVKLMTDLNH